MDIKGKIQKFGNGPIERIFYLWQSGEVGEEVARHRVTNRAFVERLSRDYLLYLSDSVVRLGYAGQWQKAVALYSLIWACFNAGREFFGDIGPKLADRYLRVSTNALWHEPNVQIYREAFDIGLREYDSTTNPEQRGILAQQIGIMHLDPYAANRTGPSDLDWWWSSAKDQISAAPDLQKGLPDVDSALNEAEKWLRRALNDVQGIVRLETLKALIQCLYARELFGGQVDEDSVRTLCKETIPLLEEYPEHTGISSFMEMVFRRLRI